MPQGTAIVDGEDDRGDGRTVAASGGCRRWRFGAGEFDEADACLVVGGRRHALDRSSQAVMRCLLMHAGQVVTKDQLLGDGWPGRVVSENSLAKAIGRLRHALDDPDGGLLCTVHGYGYRLATRATMVADRAEGAAGAAVVAAPPAADDRRPVPARSRRAWGVVVLAAMLALGVAGFLLGRAPARDSMGDMPLDSIAVLPFADMSQGQDQGYFSDGLADELLDRLAKLPQLHVAGRTSSFSFRGAPEDITSIGRKLNVATVLEGSVRRSGDRVRITVQLIKVADGFHLWSETYDRRLTDLFAVQDDIARSVVAALEVKLMPGQREAVTHHRTSNAQAYAAFLQGRHMRGGPDGDRRAIAELRRAIALDPQFAAAYVELADILGGDANYADTPAEVVAGKTASLQLMDKAIALSPEQADTYLARADMLYSTNWDWVGAQRDLDKAVALGAGNTFHYLELQSRLLCALGRVPDAIALDRRAVANDPLSQAWSSLGYHYAAVGDYVRARQSLARAVQLFPTDDHANFYLGLTTLLEGKPAEAARDFERGGSAFRLAGLAVAHHSAGDAELSQRALDTLIAKYANTSAYQVAEVYAWRGDADQAFAWLDRAYAQRDAGLIHLTFDPLMRALRPDPRYRAWLRRMGLPG